MISEIYRNQESMLKETIEAFGLTILDLSIRLPIRVLQIDVSEVSELKSKH